MKNDLDYYLQQQYAVFLRPLSQEEGGGWLAEIRDLPGCISDGETQEEALKNIEEAKKAWIVTALQRGLEIPLPRQVEDSYSGRLTLRMPRTLHKKLARAAEEEGISLNQFILSLLSTGYGMLYENSALREAAQQKQEAYWSFFVKNFAPYFLDRSRSGAHIAFFGSLGSQFIEKSWRNKNERPIQM